MQRLQGKVAIVTGAAAGIGRACALALAGEGAGVYHTDIDEEGGRETQKLLESRGGRAFFAVQDVADEAGWETVADDCTERFGPFNVLVNNAAIVIAGPIVKFTLASWKRCFSVNVEGVFLGTRTGMRRMSRSGGGSIVNMSSIGAYHGASQFSAYGATKATVRFFTKSAALECTQMGAAIRVNSVHPGIIDTDVLRHAEFDDPAMAEAMLDMLNAGDGDAGLDQRAVADIAVPFGRAGTPGEVASAVVFLASDESSYITGSEISVDGGMLAAGNLIQTSPKA